MADKDDAASDSPSTENPAEDAPVTLPGRVSKPSRSKTRQLTAEEALAIYRMRPQMKSPGRLRRGAMLHCKVERPPPSCGRLAAPAASGASATYVT